MYSGGDDIITLDIAPKARYEGTVRCLWVNEWLERDSAGDSGGRTAAVSTLEESLAWPATVAIDGGGVIEQMTLIVRAAAARDLPSVKDGYALMRCAELTKGIIQ